MHLGHTLGSLGCRGIHVCPQRKHFSVGNSKFLFMPRLYTYNRIMSSVFYLLLKKVNLASKRLHRMEVQAITRPGNSRVLRRLK